MENNEKTFEENLEVLEQIVKDLETGDVPLDKAIDKFNEGMNYAKKLDETLKKATETVTKVLDKDGNLEDFEISSEE